MMRSMFSGVSGLRVHQTKMDVIANNIANVNTVGYKTSRVTFSEVFSQTLSSASGANPASGRGGTNPMQIGLGANVASIDMLMSTGAAQRTDNPYDLMIQGDGFFVVSDNSGTYFTRAGAFRLDEDGYITTPNGMLVNGWEAVPDTSNPGQNKVEPGRVQPLRISGDDESIPPEKTTLIEVEGNLNALETPTKDSTMAFFDTLGNRYVVDVRYEYDTTAKEWGVKFGNYMYPNDDRTKGVPITMTAAAGDPSLLNAGTNPVAIQIDIVTAPPTPPTPFTWTATALTTVQFDENGYPKPSATLTPAADASSIQFKFNNATITGSALLSPESRFAEPFTLNFMGMTQFNGKTTAAAVSRDGNYPGQLSGISIGTDGKITGRYSNGATKLLGQIVLAQFKNPPGLEKVGNNLFVTTTNSGDFDGIGVDPTSGGTSLLGGVLEMSNVDLSSEFTEMITTQRGFQANSRVITTSDDMLQELVNLKR